MIIVEVGDVLECTRDHHVFRKDGEIIELMEKELLIVIDRSSFITTAIRVETSDHISIMLLDDSFFTWSQPTYVRIWP